MKKSISFITTASKDVGLGHLIRSLSLAEMLEELFDINFIIDTDSYEIIKMITAKGYKIVTLESIYTIEKLLPYIRDTHIAVLDFYKLTEQYQLAIKNNNIKLVCIDDLHESHFYADIVINISNSINKDKYSIERYTQLLLGTDYVLLRPVFLKSAVAPPRELIDLTSVFINMGGADTPNNTLKFLKALILIDQIKQIHVIIGSLNPHKETITNFINHLENNIKICVYYNIDGYEMNEVLSNCQLAICPASGISMELCSVGIGIITGYTADNQKDLLKGLIHSNCAINLHDLNLLSVFDITNSLQSIFIQKSAISEMVIRQKKLIDGLSAHRIRNVFQKL